MKGIVLYYFSGSGNTHLIAEIVKAMLIKNSFSVRLENMSEVDHVDIEACEFVGILFPVAIQSTYPNVWTFINNLPNTEGQKIFMIDTMQSFSGGVVGPVKKVLDSKGYNCVGAIELIMNSSMQTKPIEDSKRFLKNELAIKKVEAFIDDLLNDNVSWNRVPMLSDWMRSISKSKKIWEQSSQHKTINHDTCVGCKLCINKCPVAAMSMLEDKVIFDDKLCISCMKCVNICPTNAFKIKGKDVYQQNFK